MTHRRPAVHRTLVVVDVEGFGDQRRTNPHQLAVRDGLWQALARAFDDAGIRWAGCRREDRGDGVLVLARAGVPKVRFVELLPGALVAALEEHNRGRIAEERIRLRMVVHAGEVSYDRYGVAGAAVNLAFRLVEAGPLRAALAGSRGVLAVITSSWFFEEVVRHSPASDPASYRPVPVAVKETSTVGWVCLPGQPGPPGQPAAGPAGLPGAAVPRQLPAAAWHFVGREAELAALAGQLADAAGTVVISAVGGTAGIGKTALAVHFAHQVAGQFPDGQLYVNLRGFDPAGSPVTPAEAIRGFLEAFEVPPERIPVTPGAQAALYRSLLAGRRVLVVLDNARDAEQVRPLLPGSPGCMVVVTSRNQLTSLVTAEGARPLALDLLTVGEARQLLAGRLGAGRVAAEAPAVEEIVCCCARLPLALAIVAARAATHPQFPLASLAGELRDACGSLDAFGGGDAVADPRAVFSWSYQQLSPQAAWLFRLLGLHPGPDTTAWAAASLAALPAGQAREGLAELAQAHLVTESSPGRFAFHDLLRAYAIERSRAYDTEDDREAAVSRVLDHYLYTAHAASLRLRPRARPLALPPSPPGVLPEEPPDSAAAWAWFDAEHPVLLAAVEQAAVTGQDACAWQLAWTIMVFLDRQGRWDDWAATQHTALSAARRHDDRSGQAHAHAGLGFACRWLGRYDDAYTHLQQALDLFAELGDKTGQAEAHMTLSGVLAYQHRLDEALRHDQQALALSCAAGDRRGQARALDIIGWHHALLGDHHEAIAHCEKALALIREVGIPRDEARTLDSLGYAHYHLGNYQQSADYYKKSIARHRETRSRYSLATTLGHLGDTLDAAGDQPAARAAWQQALAILDHLGPILTLGPGPGYPDADQIRAKLARQNE